MLSIRTASNSHSDLSQCDPLPVRRSGVCATALSVLLVACTGLGQAGHSGKALHIGVDLPLSGAEAAAGKPALNGVSFYIQQHPTLDGFDVSAVSADDATGGKPSPSHGITNVMRFLKDPNLVAMIGPLDSSVARREIPIANAAALVMVTPATSSPCLTRDIFLPALLNPTRTAISCHDVGLPPASMLRPASYINFYRLSTTDDLQGPAAADYMFKTLHLLRAAVISDHEAYGQGLATAFTAHLEALGGTVLGQFVLDPAAPDATTFLKAMKDAGAQAVYFGGSTQGHGCAVRAQMKTVFPPGETTPFFSGDGVAEDPQCVKEADANAAGIYATVPIVDAGSRAGASQTISAFKASFGDASDYGPLTMPAYDATGVLYAALDRAIRMTGGQLPARSDVIAEVGSTKSFAGTTGTIGFDSAGDTTNRLVSIFEPGSSDPRTAWKLVTTMDYSAKLPY